MKATAASGLVQLIYICHKPIHIHSFSVVFVHIYLFFCKFTLETTHTKKLYEC